MDRCALCPGKHNVVPLSGPRQPGRPLFIGEAPGRDENSQLEPFVGKTGREVNEHYLPYAGLRREECTFTNAIKCWPVTAGGKLDPSRPADKALLKSCTQQHLNQEIAELSPSLLVPMGRFACDALESDINLEIQHGFPVETAWDIPAFPMYHPAGGLHEPKKMLQIRTDWHRLRQYLRGRLTLPRDPFSTPDYGEASSGDISDLDPSSPLAIDTESSPSKGPVFLTLSQRAGWARLIRGGSPLLAQLAEKVRRWRSVIIFHNQLYDAPIVSAMGLDIPAKVCRDTMQRAFHLGNLPQGLKALAWRELGMTMEDFDDVVRPYSQELVLDYYRRASLITWPKPPEELVRDAEGTWKLYKPQSMSTKLKRFFTDYGKNPDKDVFKMWEDNWADHQLQIVEGMGGEEWPGLDILHVPFLKALFYACRDADATLRLWFVLQRMRRQVRRFSQEHWRVAA